MEDHIWRQLTYFYLSNFYNVYLILHPYTLVRIVCQGLLMLPHNTASQVRTLSTVRHPELIALYASAPNHVLGYSWDSPAPLFWCLMFR